MAILRFFRIAGTLEAISYLVLLGIAVPLKYIWHLPLYVRWVGSFHGAFFLLFCLAILLCSYRLSWTLSKSLIAFLSSLFPFGPFLFDHYYLEKLPESKTN